MFSLKKGNNESQMMNSQEDKWWQGGLRLFFQLSGWLVGPLILALFIGRWLDDKYQTKPWLFLLSAGIAFVITSLGIVLEATKFIKQIEEETKKSNLNNQDKKENGNQSEQH